MGFPGVVSARIRSLVCRNRVWHSYELQRVSGGTGVEATGAGVRPRKFFFVANLGDLRVKTVMSDAKVTK